MELIALRGVTLARPGAPDAPPLLAGVDLDLAEGARVGLVGRSGAGKSSLLALLSGRLPPASGRVVKAPGVRVALLAQAPPRSEAGTVWEVAAAGLDELRSLERAMRAAERDVAAGVPGAEDRLAALASEHERLGGYAAAARLREVLHALGFPAARHGEAAADLSAGERRRLALAAALAAPCDVLLLDEPTNHLDLPARAWLERHLAGRGGALVLVSHDRDLLTAATNRTAFLAGGRLRSYPDGYDRAARRAAADDASSERRARELRREARRLERVAAELARHGRRSRARERRADELARSADAAAVARVRVDGPRLPGAEARRRPRGTLLDAARLTVPGLLEGGRVRLAAGDSVALMGPNGSGKSTLLRLLAGEARSADPAARVEYAPALRLVRVGQEDGGLAAREPVLDQLARVLGADAARSRLAAAGLPHAAWSLPPERLSGGERARAGLALALALSPDVLLLDEPDNDLDLHAIEALEEALRELVAAGCALVLATHDRRLAASTCRRAWSVGGGRLAAYASVRAYLRGEAPVPPETFFASAGGEATEAASAAGEPGEPEAPPDPLAELESERAELLDRLSDPVGLSERDLARARARLLEVEGEVMRLLDARLPPPAPRYAFRERGMALVADAVPEADEPLWVVAPAEGGPTARIASGAAPAPDPASGDEPCAASGDEPPRTEGPTPPRPRLEVRLLGDVAHLALVAPDGACALPHVAAALLDAGTRLAFTVAGAARAQAWVEERVPDTLLARGDGGWRFLDLGGYLAAEGWTRGRGRSSRPRGARGRPERAVDAGPRLSPGGAGRKRRRPRRRSGT
ncbi:MAG TPA: ATP-binding cassette domain-containing protein [Trueperaceae bacterium]